MSTKVSLKDQSFQLPEPPKESTLALAIRTQLLPEREKERWENNTNLVFETREITVGEQDPAVEQGIKKTMTVKSAQT